VPKDVLGLSVSPSTLHQPESSSNPPRSLPRHKSTSQHPISKPWYHILPATLWLKVAHRDGTLSIRIPNHHILEVEAMNREHWLIMSHDRGFWWRSFVDTVRWTWNIDRFQVLVEDLWSAIGVKLDDCASCFVYVLKTCQTLDTDGGDILQSDTIEKKKVHLHEDMNARGYYIQTHHSSCQDCALPIHKSIGNRLTWSCRWV
jgi:hypothetical protein